MFHAFNSRLDRRLNTLPIPADVRQALSVERNQLAAAEIPTGLNEEMRVTIRNAINESFVFGFRRVMLAGAALALAGSMVAWLTIRA